MGQAVTRTSPVQERKVGHAVIRTSPVKDYERRVGQVGLGTDCCRDCPCKGLEQGQVGTVS